MTRLDVLEGGRRRAPSPLACVLAVLVSWAIMFGLIVGLWLLLEVVWP